MSAASMSPEEEARLRRWVREGGPLKLVVPADTPMPTEPGHLMVIPEREHHGVTEWSTNPPIWVAGDEWGVTLTTADGHRVDLDARAIVDLFGALGGLEPPKCVECANYADPETGDDQTCREHAPSRRWKG